MFAVRHGTRRQHLYTRCHSPYKDMAVGRRSSSDVVAETMETGRRVANYKVEAEAGILAERVVVEGGRGTG